MISVLRNAPPLPNQPDPRLNRRFLTVLRTIEISAIMASPRTKSSGTVNLPNRTLGYLTPSVLRGTISIKGSLFLEENDFFRGTPYLHTMRSLLLLEEY